MPEKIELTKFGNEIIPVELVGRNADYRVLKNLTDPAYPRGDEVRYFDDYVFRLNEIYPLNEALGAHVDSIAQRKGLEGFVMDSPLKNSEGERILAGMLINSAQAGEWQPFIVDVPHLTDTQIGTAQKYLDGVESISLTYNRGKMDGGTIFGMAVAKRGGLALPIEHDKKVVVIPSQAFVEYIAQRK